MALLSPIDIAALNEARHPDPFAVLGQHLDRDGSVWIRAVLPGALEVTVLDGVKDAPFFTLQPTANSCVFEAKAPHKQARFDYRLSVLWASGQRGTYADAYSFDSSLRAEDIYYLAQGSHLRPHTVLGAHPMQWQGVAGVRFAVWAPNASRVSVVGDFNAWDGRRHTLRLHPGAGIWEIFIPHVAKGDRYKFELRTQSGTVLPLKSDPYAFAAELRPATASVVHGIAPQVTLPAGRREANQRNAPISIYEVHLGSWLRRVSDSYPNGEWLSWQELAATLPAYVADLGFTHVELMPVTEHPFDGSWGYQTLGLFAPTSRFGPPEGFSGFVAACHAAGIGVLLDWVPAHFPTDPFGIAQFDGTALYEYADPKEGFHKDWNTAIYNFGRNEVRSFLISNALYWLENHGLDGLRVDAVASMLYRDYSRDEGEWVPNARGGRENLEAISLLQRANAVIGEHAVGAITLAEESTSFSGVSRPVHEGGLGFHYKWNMGWMHDTLAYLRHDPAHRKWHHNQMTFGMVYAYSENFVLPLSHDEVVHGKGSLLNKMPGDRWQQLATLRAYYGFMWGHPGKKLLFMGCEFAQPTEWNHDASLPWDVADQPAHAGVRHLVRDLNQLMKSHPALYAFDCEPQGFEWVESQDADRSVFAFLRKAGDKVVLVVSNFTPVPWQSYRVGVPDAGAAHWKEVLNTDSHHYGGSNLGNGLGPIEVQAVTSQGRAQSLLLTLPPLATVMFEPC